MGFRGGSDGKESACNARDPGSIPGSGRCSEKEMAAYSSILPGKSHGRGSLVDYSPWGHKESDMTEWLTLFTFLLLHISAKKNKTKHQKTQKTSIWFSINLMANLLVLCKTVTFVAQYLQTLTLLFFSKSECVCSAAPSCLTLGDPMDCSLPGPSVHGILQARILAISFSKSE